MWIKKSVLAFVLILGLSGPAHAAETYLQHIQEAKALIKEKFELPKKNQLYTQSKDEKEKSRVVFELAVSHQLSEAQSEYERLSKEFPDSPKIASEYVLFLINRHKFDTATHLAERFSKAFPESVEISILKYSLEKYNSLHSRHDRRKKASEIFKELDLLLAAWNQLRLEIKD